MSLRDEWDKARWEASRPYTPRADRMFERMLDKLPSSDIGNMDSPAYRKALELYGEARNEELGWQQQVKGCLMLLVLVAIVVVIVVLVL